MIEVRGDYLVCVGATGLYLSLGVVTLISKNSSNCLKTQFTKAWQAMPLARLCTGPGRQRWLQSLPQWISVWSRSWTAALHIIPIRAEKTTRGHCIMSLRLSRQSTTDWGAEVLSPALEAGSPKSRYSAPSEGTGKGLEQASLLASTSSLLLAACFQSSHDAVLVHMSVSKFPLFTRMPVIRVRAILEYDLIFIYICNDSSQLGSHAEVLELRTSRVAQLNLRVFQLMNLRVAQFNCNTC